MAPNKEAIALLDRMEKHKGIADRNHIKMGWHPGTATADLYERRYMKHEAAYYEAEAELRKLLGGN